MENLKISQKLDFMNEKFTSKMKSIIAEKLDSMSDEQIEWLIFEHYQFSFANKSLLQSAVDTCKLLSNQGVSEELLRNLNEEDGHAPMYKKGMMIFGSDVETRKEFKPTTDFLNSLASLATSNSSRSLGGLYATETAAIFEHEVFFDVCKELVRRRNGVYEGSLIKHFHDIHLDGVEQGHKDGLAAFVDISNEAGNGAIEPNLVFEGGVDAIKIMEKWWTSLFTHLGLIDVLESEYA